MLPGRWAVPLLRDVHARQAVPVVGPVPAGAAVSVEEAGAGVAAGGHGGGHGGGHRR